MEKVPSAWSVAAAILIIEDCAYSIRGLTTRVRQTDLSGLGKRFGQTTEKTLGSELRKHLDIFQMNGRGVYQIGDLEKALESEDVRSVIYNQVAPLIEKYTWLLRSMLCGAWMAKNAKREFGEVGATLNRLSKLYVK